MFIAMNRFRISIGHETDFEEIWQNRESYLDEVSGFKEFHLLKGPSDEEATLYASHSVWESSATFETWTNSEAFTKAHSQATPLKGPILATRILKDLKSLFERQHCFLIFF